MKKIFLTICGIIALGTYTMAQQQDTQNVTPTDENRSVGEAIKDGAKTVAHETAEKASKGKAHIVDKVYDDKVGPQGQTIYINEHAKFYWINEKGQKISISEARLKDKTED